MTDANGADPLVVYADYVCPFCYLGRASLRQYRADADDPPPVEWRPFDLRGHKRGPDGEIDETVDDGKDEAYYERARRNVERLADRYDVEMTLDGSQDVDSWNAHRAALHVERTDGEEAFRAFHDAVFDALWQDGRDVGDPDVLAEVAASVDGDADAGVDADAAASVDLDPEAVRAAATDDSLDADLRERFEDARRRGVTAVPTFEHAGEAARGAVPPADLQRLVEGG